MTSLSEFLQSKRNDLDNHDLAVLADWAGEQKNITPNHDWKKAFALIREGSDLLLRRRARSTMQMTGADPASPIYQNPQEGVTVDYYHLRRHLNDFTSTFYGPHACEHCQEMIIKRSIEQGGEVYDQPMRPGDTYSPHICFGKSPAPLSTGVGVQKAI